MTKDKFAIAFLNWRDEHFYIHGNGLYYPKVASKYFDPSKHIGKEKATTYFAPEELLEMFKGENQ